MSERKNFGSLSEVLDIPDLIGLQLDSFGHFLQKDSAPSKRKNKGLHEVLREIFPVESFDGQLILNYASYKLGEPKASVIDCIKDGQTYCAPLHVDFTLENKGEKLTETVFFGDIPLMTERGTFVVNGAERVVISQLHRSPGICYETSRHSSGRTLYSFRIIPDRGSWMEVQFDINDLIYIFLDRRRRRRKFLITTLLRAIGYESNEDMLSQVYKIENAKLSKLLNLKDEELAGCYSVEEVSDSSGNVIIEELTGLDPDHLKALSLANKKSLKVVYVHGADYLIQCLRKDPTRNQEEALKEVYRRMRPGDPPSINNAKQLLNRLFFDVRRYDLGTVGRFKLNQKLNLDAPADLRVLRKEDLMEATKGLMELRHRGRSPDDIDHLGSRRVRTVGELLQNQCRVGMIRTERLIRERMTLLGSDESAVTPGKLINPKAFAGVVRDFFARHQLSQFMDQTNPLSELTNKRRLSALGPGGLSRERAGFEVRDVHPSHYGRVCPIETPEGPNIGLISSMSLFARINGYGFLETPYRVVRKGKVSDEIEYLTADKEEEYVIAQANAPLDEKGHFKNPMVMSRYHGESRECPAEDVHFMDVSPKQLVSAAAGLIPFLEHDDANRALMGSNMQRQAVPLLTTDSPLVGTGLERLVARDSRAVEPAVRAGKVASVTGDAVVVTSDGKMPTTKAAMAKADVYEINKFLRSNAGTCVNQRPIVRKGQKISKGDIIADGAGTSQGELALGKNVLVAFMPWCGYNFEDAIVISERLVKDDVYTSVHIDEFEIVARDTKLGPEEITRDIPNVSEEALRNLGPDGIIRLGAEVKPGDILVGKITPKSETELAPEERLLRAIFGEKAADVKDSSLLVSSGKGGIVMDVRVERSHDPNRHSMTKSEIRRQMKSVKDLYKAEYSDLADELIERLSDIMLGQKLSCPIYDDSSSKKNAVLISANRKVTHSSIAKLANKYRYYRMEDCPLKKAIDKVVQIFAPRFEEIEESRDNAIHGLENGEISNPGIVRKVKVYVASKRKVEVGDKMAGRHGNKGIVAKIVPSEDMPFMEDGTPVDIVLNPLGVPSRMNVGQVLETHLGWAARMLGIKVATPVFDGTSESQIVDMMNEAAANSRDIAPAEKKYDWGFVGKGKDRKFDGKTVLYDGRSGEKFEQRVMVGYIYMMKLDHLIANKIHARAVGPYSLVTQQPLGGKAQHGGQRFGEMEVWALEAYGAAYTLQEMLTVKSDDIIGRARMYESIVKGQNLLETNRPESFNVLLKEIQSLGIDIRITNKKQEEQ